MSKTSVAFICTHNSCRSQIAEALGKKLAGDTFESYSAGTSIKDQINPDAVRLMKQHYGIDMLESGQKPKKSLICQISITLSPWAAGFAVLFYQRKSV